MQNLLAFSDGDLTRGHESITEALRAKLPVVVALMPDSEDCVCFIDATRPQGEIRVPTLNSLWIATNRRVAVVDQPGEWNSESLVRFTLMTKERLGSIDITAENWVNKSPHSKTKLRATFSGDPHVLSASDWRCEQLANFIRAALDMQAKRG